MTTFHARALAIGGGVALGALALGAWGLSSDEVCPGLDVRLGVAHRADDWAAEARLQQWAGQYACEARVRVALFAPGGTWEAEALEAGAFVEVPVEPRREAPGPSAVAWEGRTIVVSGAEALRIEVERFPSEGHAGRLRVPR